MKDYLPVLLIAIMLALILLSGGALVWLAPVPDAELTPTQDHLIQTADGMIKFALGAVLGIVAGMRLANVKGVGGRSG